VAAAYALATGASVPVLRSAVGAGLAFAALALGRRAGASQALAVAALVLLAVDPGAVGDVSFQLSFVSVLGLVALSGPLRTALPFHPDPERRLGRATEALLRAACASAAATIATAPLLALHFRSLSTVAVLANLVAIPVASALTVLAALAYLASAVAPPAAAPALALCGPLTTLFLRLNEAFATPRIAAVGVASPGWGGVAFAFGAGTLALVARGRARWFVGCLAMGAVLLP
jgi:competence protein ComEC